MYIWLQLLSAMPRSYLSRYMAVLPFGQYEIEK